MNRNEYEYLIIGGGVAGATAAETIRQKKSTASVAVINDEPYALYSRVMLSKPSFFLGKIPFDQVWLKGAEWYKEHNITFLGGKKAFNIDAINKTVSLAPYNNCDKTDSIYPHKGYALSRKGILENFRQTNKSAKNCNRSCYTGLDDGTKYGYKKLLIATGVCPKKWEVAGADKKGVYYLRTLDDGKAIMEAVKSAKRAITIGGGFISFEMAELLKMAGLETTAVIRESYFWEPTLDEASGRMIEKALKDRGVKITYKAEVSEISGKDEVEGIVLKDGRRIECDMIICGIGAVCEAGWLKSSELKLNRGILTNEYLETSLPDVWAAGDVAEFKDLILDETVQLGNWVNAREQGRIAGLNMIGEKTPFKFVSFYSTQGFGISIAFIGDARPGPERIVIKRGSPEANSYARIIILNKGDRKEVEGATLINRTGEMSAIAKLIESNIDVSQKLKELADPNFALKSL